ncbi:MAG: MFS transporter [Alphaproteobacteria bacterium]|nr:MFS transporter [Alphaproteobacteria bacterium]MBN9556865.1 MFS transporter [Alphaproteobacteria bacterium]MBN9566099.1 MFS transporter [Alphaproteobacteria bacterium]MBN9578406.1 MFS transporter [Alphaproteobacteria bacterium]OJU56694.1 MAG: MFS transporter [Alphaproteobacteria bacterium 62-8]
MSVSPPVYRNSDFYSFVSARFLATIGMMVQSVAIGWQIYAISDSTLALGFVGLAQFVPMFLLTLPAGDISDRFDQRKVLAGAYTVEALCGALFLILSLHGTQSVWPFYAVLTLFGAARGFSGPAGQSLIAFLVPEEKLPRAIALNSSAFTTAVIAGPALGGFLYALGPVPTYATCAIAFLGAGFFTFGLGGRRRDDSAGIASSALARVAEGVGFVRSRPVVLGAISLDLFAVLLGGAVALLPVYARDILHEGPVGLGILRSAPAAGAALVALLLARWPLERHSGRVMFSAVAVFGIATIVFGLSTNFMLSLVALFVLGASDMISVFIRSSLIQFATPDAMRGRVSAVNMLFIGASNELGEFESGITAAWFGTMPAVVLGGLGTLGVVGLWMWMFPPLRKVDRLHDVAPKAVPGKV